jgi:hypothetical protein
MAHPHTARMGKDGQRVLHSNDAKAPICYGLVPSSIAPSMSSFIPPSLLTPKENVACDGSLSIDNVQQWTHTDGRHPGLLGEFHTHHGGGPHRNPIPRAPLCGMQTLPVCYGIYTIVDCSSLRVLVNQVGLGTPKPHSLLIMSTDNYLQPIIISAVVSCTSGIALTIQASIAAYSIQYVLVSILTLSYSPLEPHDVATATAKR